MAARAARARAARGTKPLRLGNDADSAAQFSAAPSAARPARPTTLTVNEVRRDGTSASGEQFPNLVVVGDEVYIEVELDTRLSETQDVDNATVDSSGQLSTLQSGGVGANGLKYFFRLKAVKSGTEPTVVKLWDEDGQLLEVPVWFEVVTAQELRRRLRRGSLGNKSGEMRGPIDSATPYAPGEQDVQSDKNLLRTSKHHGERHAASSAGNAAWQDSGYSYANAELDRAARDPRLRKRVGEYIDDVEEKDVGHRMPQPLPSYVGYPAYYQARHDDFNRRNPALKPPDYYLDYGRKYARRFTNALFPHLGAQGKAWLIRARTLLQLAFEERIIADASGFDRLEKQNDAFREVAYDSHAGAYIGAGLADLSVADLYRIATTPDFFDLFNANGRRQVKAVFPDLVLGQARKIAKPYKDIAGGTKRALTDPRIWDLR